MHRCGCLDRGLRTEMSSSLCSTVRASSLGVKPFGLIRHGPKDIWTRIGDPDGQNDDRANWHRLQSGSPRFALAAIGTMPSPTSCICATARRTKTAKRPSISPPNSAPARSRSKQPKLSLTQQLDSGRRKPKTMEEFLEMERRDHAARLQELRAALAQAMNIGAATLENHPLAAICER